MRAEMKSPVEAWKGSPSEARRLDINLNVCAACKQALRADGVRVQTAMSSRACRAAGAPAHPAPISKRRMSEVSMMHMLCHSTKQFGFIVWKSGPYDFMTCTTRDFVRLARGS